MGILPKVLVDLFLNHQLTIGGGKFGHLLCKKQGDDALVSCIIGYVNHREYTSHNFSGRYLFAGQLKVEISVFARVWNPKIVSKPDVSGCPSLKDA